MQVNNSVVASPIAPLPDSAVPQVGPRAGPVDAWSAVAARYRLRPPPRLSLFPPRSAPAPDQVRQDPQWNDCHLLAPLQAVVARYPFYPHMMLRAVPGGVLVRCF